MKQNLADLAVYQNDSIVSKNILKNSAGSITFFAFDKNQSLSEHTAPFDAFFYLIEGNADVSINEITHSLTNGEFTILPANIPHAVVANTQMKFLLAMLKT